MLVRLALLAIAAALVLAYTGRAEASHPFQNSGTIVNINYLHSDFEPGGDGRIFYRLCDNAGRGVPAEWGAGVEKWDVALARFEFDPVTSCSETVSGSTILKWGAPGFCGANAIACWRTWTNPIWYTPHASHHDILLGVIVFESGDWDAAPNWRAYMPAHEFGHDLSLADHVSHNCGENTLMLNYQTYFPPSPCPPEADPRASDISSVLCNVYHRCGDFSGDSCTDVLVREGDVLKIVRGNCGGAFSDQTAVPIGTGWGWTVFDRLLRPGDFNGNSPNSNAGEACTDVIAEDHGSPYWARLYRGNCGQGGNYFKDTCCGTQIGSGWGIFSWVLAPGDFNGDNCADVIFREGDVLKMVRGNCAGGFIDQTAIPISGTGWSAVNGVTWILGPGDWNGDGCADLIARFSNGTLKLYGGNCGAGGQYFKDNGTNMGGGVNWSNYSRLAAVGDFTGDGCMDLFSRDSVGTLRVHYGNCGTGFNGSGTIVGTGWNIFDYIY